MKVLDSMITWVIFLAIVTVIVASGQTDTAISGVSQLVQSLISTITAPQTSKS